MTQPFIERRNHPRRDLRVRMELELPKLPDAEPKLLGEFAVKKTAFARNISVGGILVLLSEEVTPGTRIRVTVPIHEYEASVSLVGEVVRCETGEMGYEVALRFLSSNAEDSAIISRYVAAK